MKPSKEQLQDLYLDKGLSTTQIGQITGMWQSKVSNLLMEYGIPARKKGWHKRFTYNTEHLPSDPLPESNCAHHWIIDPPNGPTSKSVCKKCGAKTEFRNSGWYSPMIEEVSSYRENSDKIASLERV